jgi:signal peptidase I
VTEAERAVPEGDIPPRHDGAHARDSAVSGAAPAAEPSLVKASADVGRGGEAAARDEAQSGVALDNQKVDGQKVDGRDNDADGDDGASRGGPTRRRGRGSFARELPLLILVAFGLALIIKAFFIQAFWIPTASMERTLLINDRVLVNKMVYDFRDPRRGEIVVFNGEGTGFQHAETFTQPPTNTFSRALRAVQGVVGLGPPSDKDFIKRVIGIGGDTVACCDAQGRVTVNGKPLNEPYIYQNNDPSTRSFAPVKVPKGQLFVMGDHRSDSSDSRYNQTIPTGKVVGKAFVRVWPLGRMGVLSTPHVFAEGPGPVSPIGDPLAAVVLILGANVVRRRGGLLGETTAGDGSDARGPTIGGLAGAGPTADGHADGDRTSDGHATDGHATDGRLGRGHLGRGRLGRGRQDGWQRGGGRGVRRDRTRGRSRPVRADRRRDSS